MNLNGITRFASQTVTATEAIGYERVLRPLLFRKDPEVIHDQMMNVLSQAGPLGNFGSQITSNLPVLRIPDAPVTCGGVRFRHPVILAAGLDKSAQAARMWSAIGFAGAELGTFTPRPQPGNPSPRMFRMPEDHAIINRMGFNNPGVESAAGLLRSWGVVRGNNALGTRIGMSIGKNKTTPNEDFIADYATCMREVSDVADYVAINVSSPNTPGLRDLQDPAALRALLQALNDIRGTEPDRLPLWLKIAPDMDWPALDGILEAAQDAGVDAIIATNTTNARPVGLRSPMSAETGGLSGAPLTKRSLEVVRYVAAHSRVDVVASGGIMTAADAHAALAAGAKAIQLYTGFIYRGPALIREIVAGISAN
ncbi:quinone-dependent dihydroorotate dehydrogenase [Trueperella pecoris]|uniref:quinone-dependent dihydroorotate dehydrogenase n=1 Tax=Trueperella pecoris TaxID=2733571 RepID=UPI00186B6E79|nr:quinone-dependent dihydroorotate dehydrogenase [Trueperella pecoris]QOQ39517.1 quinone-dependent dihydroorotate dehydrogenase [Trueperella pecoris]